MMEGSRAARETMLSDQKFNSIMRELEEKQRRYVDRFSETSQPFALVLSPKGDGEHQMDFFQLEESLMDRRKELLFQVGQQIACTGRAPTAVFLVSEAWQSTNKGKNKDLRPSQDPDRKEVVMISGLTMDRRLNGALIEIVRNDGKVSLGKAKFFPYSGGSEGGGDNLLYHFFVGYASAVMRRALNY